jgi:hypothetical protein
MQQLQDRSQVISAFFERTFFTKYVKVGEARILIILGKIEVYFLGHSILNPKYSRRDKKKISVQLILYENNNINIFSMQVCLRESTWDLAYSDLVDLRLEKII